MTWEVNRFNQLFRNTFEDLLMRDPADTRRYLDVDSTRNER